MKLTRSILFSALLFFTFGFKGATKIEIPGAFGVSKSDAANLELRLNPDKTFTYAFISGQGKKVTISGNWELKNEAILLKDYTSEIPFHTKWKMEEDGMAIRSKRGLNFYRLVRL